MRYVSIPMRGMATPTDQQIGAVLKEMNDPASGPVFVHCRRGADRTGGVIACYRISHDHWDAGKALAEANGYGMSIFQVAIKRYVSRCGGQPAAFAVLPAAIVPAK
jgi:protein tyrosine/serine phosphatase